MADRITIKGAKSVVIEGGQGAAAAKSAGKWDGESVAGVLVKADAAQRKTWHVFYPADKADVSTAADGHRDFASKAAVEEAAHGYMLQHRQVGIMHADGTEGRGQLIESGIHRGPDWVVKAADGAEHVVREGDWVGAILWEPETWEHWESGRLRGVSPQGRARRRPASPETVAALRS